MNSLVITKSAKKYETGYNQLTGNIRISRIEDIILRDRAKSLHEIDRDCYRIVIADNRTLNHTAESNTKEGEENKVYCFRPGQVCSLQYEYPADGYYLCFNSSLMSLDSPNGILLKERLFGMANNCTAIEVCNVIEKELYHAVENIYREYKSASALKLEMMQQYLKIILILLSRKTPVAVLQQNPSSRLHLVNRFFALVQKNFATKKQVIDYASLLAVSPNYLNNLVKKVSGYPASYHIQQHIINEAKRKAVYSDSNMKEIAFALGFEEITHFSKFFKKVEGVNFSQYKKNSIGLLYH